MASAPSDPRPVLGRVDAAGRLVAADPELERLQREAGSDLGAPLALPQLASVARMAQRLRIPVSRRILAAGRDRDIDMWVRAVIDGDEVALTIDRWTSRPAAPPRLASIRSSEPPQLAAPALDWSVDDQLRVVGMAPALADLLSVDLATAIGQPLTKLLRLEENEDGAMPLLGALASRTSFSGQRAVSRSGGEVLLLSGRAVIGDDGSFVGFEGDGGADSGGSGEGQAIADLSIHTALKSPLDNIVHSAESMVDAASGPVRDEYAAYAADIATAARHLLSVVRSMGEQAQGPDGGAVDLAQLADEAIGLVETAAKERGIIIGMQPVESCRARGESRSVIQVLVNLIGNAVRYSPESSAVTISFERADGRVMVHVADEGPGIDPADHERIFEPFQQGSTGNQGTGLGLAIARRLARGMGGDVRLSSAPGQGSRFTLELPAA